MIMSAMRKGSHAIRSSDINESDVRDVGSADKSFKTITHELGKAQKRMVVMAWVLLTLAVVGSVVAVCLITSNTGNALAAIIAYPDSVTVFVFELLRSGSFAALAAGFVWVLFGLGRQALDQSVRYEKRLMAAHFMNFVVARYDEQVRESKITISDVSSFLDSWSATVESAFTKGRIPPKSTGESLAFSVGAEGVSFAANPTSRKSAKAAPSEQSEK
ncbi:hypothetical protein [Microbacterium enclense]|uniref:hypothetical protein n=1 Tax=Microbacterium enclense TaxID=993073 RepID=UPI003F817F53